MMFWALSNDSRGDQSLITAASELLRGSATFDEVMSRSEPFDFILGGDGQFEVNDFSQPKAGSVAQPDDPLALPAVADAAQMF